MYREQGLYGVIYAEYRARKWEERDPVEIWIGWRKKGSLERDYGPEPRECTKTSGRDGHIAHKDQTD